MAIILVRAIYWFAQILTFLLVLRAVFSWFARDPYSTSGKIYGVLIRLTEPIVNPCRQLLYKLNINTGMFDFSVLIAFFLIEITANILAKIVLTVLV